MGILHQPFVYRLGPLEVGGFGFAMLMAFVIAQLVAQRELARRGHDPTPIGDLIIAAVVGGLVGAKLYYAVLTQDPGAIFSRAGFVFWGGLIGGSLVVLLVIRIKKLSVGRIADVAGISIAAAYSVGRTGCWAVGDDYGRPWNSALAVRFPEGAPPSTVENLSTMFGIEFPPGTDPGTVVAVHPTQLYETAAGFVMFLVLWRMRDHRHAEGWLFGVYCILAGVERFLVEFVRAKDDRFFAGLTAAQVIAVAFVVVGVLVMYARRNVTPGSPGIHARRSTMKAA
ncbi:MAG TPA: prolipoprotein diacylglyceryl transferase [Gemmatimonadaceae bacterium]|nr:prolipoprotein diacylglyceryl transferase [Gemmatimonadaceae bacterium]